MRFIDTDMCDYRVEERGGGRRLPAGLEEVVPLLLALEPGVWEAAYSAAAADAAAAVTAAEDVFVVPDPEQHCTSDVV